METDSVSISGSETGALKEAILQLQNHKTLEEFAEVWHHIGLEAHHRQERRTTIVEHMGELLDEMLNEEKLLKDRMIESVRTCMQEMTQLELELKLTTTHNDLDSKTLLEKERLSRSRVDALNKIKHDRMKRFKRLTEMEIALCKSIGASSELSDKFHVQNVPSEDDLQSFRKRVELLESTKDSRQVEFRNTREKAIEIWSELEMSPTDSMGIQLQQGNVTKFVFSEENMTCLAEYFDKVKRMAIEQERKAEQLRNTIIPLWEKLEIPGVFREDYLTKHSGYKSWMIEEMESELDRLNILKRENLERFISTVRVELNKFWNKCMFGDMQRREFEPAYNDVYTDDTLSAHESELDRISGFFADNVEVFKLVQKRDTMWKQKLEMEARANDPNRLKNRGGKLLQEQKQQQRVEREYPKIEANVRQTIEQWEEDHCRPFLVHDTRYIDKIDDEVHQHNIAKEKEKTKRQKVKAETTMLEMRFGTKPPSTPTPKRKAAACLTPGDKLSKIRKVEPSPLMRTTSAKNRITVKAKTKHNMTPSLRRRALRDRNIPSCTSSTTTTTTTDSGNNSLASNELSLASAGSYNDFQQEFVKGIENRKTARSSAIPKSSSTKNLAY